jgi:hypothetical protein
MYLRRIVSHLTVCSAWLLLSVPAAAQQTDGAFQFSLITELAAYTNGVIELEATGTEIDTTVTHFGIRDAVALEVGYGIGEMLIAGAFVRVGGEAVSVEIENGSQSESNDFGLQVGPKLAIVFGDDTFLVRPFAGLAVSLEWSRIKDEAMGSATENLETSLLGINLQGRTGVHWFVLPALSIDPMVGVGWGTGGGEVDEIAGSDSLEVSATGFNLSLMLGVSGWIR